MPDVAFSTELVTELRSKLGENFQVLPEYESATEGLDRVHDLVILEDGHLRMLFELEVDLDSFEAAKNELRKFYEEKSGEEAFMLAVCSSDCLLVFDAENELLGKELEDDSVETIVSEIEDLLTS